VTSASFRAYPTLALKGLIIKSEAFQEKLTIYVVSVDVICVRFPVYPVQQDSRIIVSGHVMVPILDVIFLQTRVIVRIFKLAVDHRVFLRETVVAVRFQRVDVVLEAARLDGDVRVDCYAIEMYIDR